MVVDMSTQKRAPQWYTPTDVGDLVGVTSETIRRWVREGRLHPTVKTAGGQFRWRKDDLDAQLTGLLGPSAPTEVPELPAEPDEDA